MIKSSVNALVTINKILKERKYNQKLNIQTNKQQKLSKWLDKSSHLETWLTAHLKC